MTDPGPRRGRRVLVVAAALVATTALGWVAYAGGGTTPDTPAATVSAVGRPPSGAKTAAESAVAPRVGTVGEVTWVGPAAGAPLHGIDRDSGVSVQLRDRSMLWLFGDSAGFDANGTMTYFVIGTAAWAPADDPLRTQEFAQRGEPVAAGSPTMTSPTCERFAPRPGMWPMSAIVEPRGELDRVIVWFENICLGSGVAGTSKGMAVGEWYYDPSDPPAGRPITFSIMNQQLFPTRSFGMASVLGPDGLAYVYGCAARDGGGGPDAYGPCEVGRVPLDRVATANAYEVWTGSEWAPYGAPAAPLGLPDARSAAPIPPGMFSVARDPANRGYVMAYSPWPANSAQLEVRTAPAPQGPWSESASVELPGCADVIADHELGCYAASLQPFLSSKGTLGIGWYDRVVQTSPKKGNYVVATVPFDANR